MNILNKLFEVNYHYIFPFAIGIFGGLFIRDSYLLSPDKKISMALVNYYDALDEQPNEELIKEFPQMKELIKINNKMKNINNQELKKI